MEMIIVSSQDCCEVQIKSMNQSTLIDIKHCVYAKESCSYSFSKYLLASARPTSLLGDVGGSIDESDEELALRMLLVLKGEKAT